jgi:hypothetical protein
VSTPASSRIIPQALVDRALAVVQPWSGASAEERILARQILRDAAKQRTGQRVDVADEFRPQA